VNTFATQNIISSELKNNMQKPWYKTEIGRFRTVAICEGISFLVLLFIAMPLKYIANMPHGCRDSGLGARSLICVIYVYGIRRKVGTKLEHKKNFNSRFLHPLFPSDHLFWIKNCCNQKWKKYKKYLFLGRKLFV
jgi:hypothetical protein